MTSRPLTEDQIAAVFAELELDAEADRQGLLESLGVTQDDAPGAVCFEPYLAGDSAQISEPKHA